MILFESSSFESIQRISILKAIFGSPWSSDLLKVFLLTFWLSRTGIGNSGKRLYFFPENLQIASD